jgi:SAM-dependent methyltransferase
MPPTVLTTAEGSVEVLLLPDGRHKVTLQPTSRDVPVSLTTCETSFPLDVISAFLDFSFPWLCDSLARYDDPDYVSKILRQQLFAYFDAAEFRGKRILDFGCGTGASTVLMGAMLPETEIVGVELDARRIELARRVLAVRKLSNVRFLTSPNPESLPPGIGSFDFVMLSAVYEHLLPEERRRVMPLIWSSLNDGGVLFINQTPHRYFPYEHHSTGLWMINYFPDRLSLFLARRFSRRNPAINKSRDWATHLRGGIRGGTEAEIIRNLRRAGVGRPTIIQPKGQDRAAYWLSCLNPDRHRLFKQFLAGTFRVTDKLWRTVPSMNIDVVIRKNPA